MKATLTITSKGQLTVPAKARKAMHLRAGDKLILDFNEHNQHATITKPLSIAEVQAMNQKIMKERGISFKDYQSGDGFRAHVAKKYGT